MKILGIDPGTALTGFGLINYKNKKPILIEYGVIETKKNTVPEKRLGFQKKELEKILKKHNPDLVAAERLFFVKNVKTGIAVAQSRGVILETLYSFKIPIREFIPTEVKMAVVGYGRAEKSQVQNMVKHILNLQEIPRPDDAADALALAICCAHNLGPEVY